LNKIHSGRVFVNDFSSLKTEKDASIKQNPV